MFSRISLLLNCFVFLLFSTGTLHAATFLESGGVVVMEAESSPATGQWSRESRVGGAKGGAYLIWKGPDLFSGNAAGRDTLRYTFRVQKAGNYELRWRSFIAEGNNPTEANDSWVRFPTGRNVSGQQAINGWTKVFQNQANQWSWSSKTVDNVGKSVRQFFSTGDHVIEVSGRSHGHAIDRIVLFRYADVSYSQSKFDGFQVSSTVGGSQAPQDNQQEQAAQEAAEQAAQEAAERAAEQAAQEAAERAAEQAAQEAQEAAERAAEQAAQEAAERAAEQAAQEAAEREAEQAASSQLLADANQSDNAEAPVLAVSGSRLTWNAVDAIAINVHGQNGEWIESIAGNSTQWTAISSGRYYIVATNDQTWEAWGRSNTVEVNLAAGSSSVNTDASVIDSLYNRVYSNTAAELFWSVSDSSDLSEFVLEKDGVVVFSGEARSYFDDQLLPGVAYLYTLKVLDNGAVVDQWDIRVVSQGPVTNELANINDSQLGGVNQVQLRGEVYSSSALELRWDRSTQPDAFAFTYNLYQDGQLVSDTDAISYYADGLDAGQTYRFTLKARDANGVEGAGFSISLTTNTAN